jgi:hypothetical protein
MSLDAKLEFVFKARVYFASRMKFAPGRAGIVRGYTGAGKGTVEGPRLTGSVVEHSGGDWPYFMPNGVVYFDAKYILKADDGTEILLNNRGLRHAPPDILAKMNAFERIDPSSYYFRIIPSFDAPAGPHAWLNHTIIVGGADRTRDYSDFYYYAMV